MTADRLAHFLSSVLSYFASRFVRCGQCAGAILLSDIEGCIQRLDVQERLSAYGELVARVSLSQTLIDFTAKAVRVIQQIEVLHQGVPVARLSVEKVATCRDGDLRAYVNIDIDEAYDGQLLELLCGTHPYYHACTSSAKVSLSEFIP